MAKQLRVEEMEAQSAEIASEIRRTLPSGDLPPVFALLAHDPEHMEIVWRQLKHIMDPQRPDHKLKHLLALAVCAAVGSQHFVSHQIAALRREGVDDREIVDVLEVVQLWTGMCAVATAIDSVPDDL